MKQKNNPIFIPIFYIPGLMGGDYSKYHKEYCFLKTDVFETIKTTGSIDSDGRAIVEVVIRPKNKKTIKLKKENKRVEQVILKALIDTGAQISSIRKDKAKLLNIKSFNGIKLSGLNKKSTQMKNANLSIHLLNRSKGFLDICPVLVDFNDEYEFDFIIGWDVLKYCEFSYNGNKNTFNLEFIEGSR